MESNGYKIRIKDEAHGVAVLERLVKLGFIWDYDWDKIPKGHNLFILENKYIIISFEEDYFNNNTDYQEITLENLKTMRTKRELTTTLQGLLISCNDWLELHFDKKINSIEVDDIQIKDDAPNDFKEIVEDFLDDLMSRYSIKVDTSVMNCKTTETEYDYAGGFIIEDKEIPLSITETPDWYILDKISEDVSIVYLEG